MKVYLDNVIVCGRVRNDLDPIEVAAVRRMEAAKDGGQLNIVTSRESWREQDRTKDQALRSQFHQDRPNVPVVTDDHRVLGIHNSQDHLGGFSVCPLVTEVVDEELLRELKRAGLKDADARHLMYATHNTCDRFVTTDPHFLDQRADLEALCRGVLIRKPSELAAELAAMGN